MARQDQRSTFAFRSQRPRRQGLRLWKAWVLPVVLLGLAIGQYFGWDLGAVSDLPPGRFSLTPVGSQAIAGTASVIDGDTLEIHDQRIRLHGVDAPESSQTCTAKDGREYRCGQQAALALQDKIAGRPVSCAPRDRDRYGRIVAVCTAGGEDLNRWLVLNGWAMAYREYSLDYVEVEADARSSRIGIWQGRFTPPREWRREASARAASSPQVVRGTTGKSARFSPSPVGDRDCADFRTWTEAQAFFRNAGPGDPHRLDADGDGIACETLRR
jgi:endonuclease YncB( thermonuclease family)